METGETPAWLHGSCLPGYKWTMPQKKVKKINVRRVHVWEHIKSEKVSSEPFQFSRRAEFPTMLFG